MTTRPQDIRLREYRDSLRSQASQVEDVGKRAGKPKVVEDTVRLFRLVADDLTSILEGRELAGFVITGTVPGPADDSRT